MPQSPDAERAVLGAVLINNHAFYRVIGTVDTEDFFKDAHRTIFATMRRMAEQSREIEPLTLKEELAKHALLDQVGGVAYISSLLDIVPDVANVERYAQIVKEKSMLRRLIVMGNSVMRAALDAPSEPSEVLTIAEKSLYEIAEGTTEKGFVSLEKMGKTSFMMNIAEAIAIPGADGLPRAGAERLHSVGVFSLEMSKEQIGVRILSSESGVPMHMLRSGFSLSQKNWDALGDAARRVAKGKIFIDDTPGIDPLEMRAKARRLKREIGLDVVMVDYLQLMSVKGKVESRQQEISQISRSLKAVAKELDLPVISLSQLSRRPEQRTGDHRPQLADLRESGAIEQDADMVCFIYRDEVYNKDAEKGKAEIIIAKQRNGPIGEFPLVFLHETTKFMNFEPSPT